MLTQDNLPDTLSPLSNYSGIQQVQDQILPWGRLFSLNVQIPTVDLVPDLVTVGRFVDCNIVISGKDENWLKSVSKRHFSMEFNEKYACLRDTSKNGTYVNDKLIKNGSRIILETDDRIAVGQKNLVLFIFKYLRKVEEDDVLPVMLRRNFKLSGLLGKGACGLVHLVFERATCKPFAVKRIVKGSFNSTVEKLNHPLKIKNEINILRNLSHVNVISLHDIYETETDVFMILEYMAGGELSKQILSIQPMSEQEIKFLFYQMVLGVDYLHLEGITHRDLKPDNILLASDCRHTLIKISDFGLSKVMGELSFMETICGTPNYVAPEIIDSDLCDYTQQVDIWSLGVILFRMFSQEHPFAHNDRRVLNKLIQKGEYKMSNPIWNNVTYPAKDLVRKMLKVDPDKRITIEEIKRHLWIASDASRFNREIDELVRQYDGNPRNDIDVDKTDIGEEGPVTKRLKLSTASG